MQSSGIVTFLNIWLAKAFWLALFFCLGSIGYVLTELSRLKNGEGLEKIRQRK